MLARSTDILIVGAGPAGLALAIALRQAGLDPLIIDRLAEGENTSRAAVIHAHTLEMLETLGVAETLEQHGLVLSRFVLREHDRVLLSLDFSTLPSRHAEILLIPQDETERVLTERLRALGGTVQRGVTATALAQMPGEGEGAEVRLATPSGEQTVRARYVIGGDGMHSVVRAAAGIAFDGGTYEETFVLADVRMDGLPAGEAAIYFSPEGMAVVVPLPGGRHRIVAPVDNPPEMPDLADIQAIVAARGPRRPVVQVRAVLWSSRFRVHNRVASRYRSGPFFVMGDAAHVHSPAGGQGMNTGLIDAILLGRLLADVLQGRRPAAALDLYQAKRKPAAVAVLTLADRLTRIATVRSRPVRSLRNLALRLLGASPVFRRRLTLDLSGLSRRDLSTLPAPE